MITETVLWITTLYLCGVQCTPPIRARDAQKYALYVAQVYHGIYTIVKTEMRTIDCLHLYMCGTECT